MAFSGLTTLVRQTWMRVSGEAARSQVGSSDSLRTTQSTNNPPYGITER